MARRLALALLAAVTLVPTALARRAAAPARAAPPCAPEGRGIAPREWLGCAADEGPPRALTGAERLVLGLPLDLNAASEGELAFVPGLSRRLARAVVADRAENGPFDRVEALERVKGIGPVRVARARATLTVGRSAVAQPPRPR